MQTFFSDHSPLPVHVNKTVSAVLADQFIDVKQGGMVINHDSIKAPAHVLCSLGSNSSFHADPLTATGSSVDATRQHQWHLNVVILLKFTHSPILLLVPLKTVSRVPWRCFASSVAAHSALLSSPARQFAIFYRKFGPFVGHIHYDNLCIQCILERLALQIRFWIRFSFDDMLKRPTEVG